MSMRGRWLATLGILIVLGAAARADEVESTRFDNQKFYDGLIKLDLLDLLDEHLRTNPPKDELVRLLLERQIKLVVWRNDAVELERRRTALREANAILARMIAEHPQDPRVIDWQLELGRSLIYEQAEPLYTAILYRGGSESDGTALASLMQEAAGVLVKLKENLEAEYARVDELSLAEYERLDENGHIQKLEQAMPQAEYMLRWAQFYQAIALAEGDSQRRSLLEDVLHSLTDDSALLTTEHAVSHAQAQSLLLAGMTSRRLNDNETANSYLRDSAEVVDNLTSPQEKHDLQWIILLSSVERVRALRDSEKYADALDVLAAVRQQLASAGASDFGRKLILAMFEATVRQAQVEGGRGKDALAGALSDAAIAPLASLAAEQPAYRDEVYATLYEQCRENPNQEKLHPLQQCALVAGLIGDATRLRQGGTEPSGSDAQRAREARAQDLLARAITLAATLAADPQPANAPYRCEALFNEGVAEHLRSRRAEAAQRFLDVAEGCPDFNRAITAATYAVEIAAEMANDPSLADRREVRTTLLKSLNTLVTRYADSEAARYWRFFYGQALEDSRAMAAAAEQYAAVERTHPHYAIARFRAGRCLAIRVTELSVEQPENKDEIQAQASRARTALEGFLKIPRDEAGEDAAVLESARAEAEVLIAELDTRPGAGDPQRALAQLDGFEERYPQESGLIGRVLRARIIAFEATGKLAEAEQAVPRYIASAPLQAGITLQALFDAIWAEVARSRASGRDAEATAKAKSALLFAEQLYRWAQSHTDTMTPPQLNALRLQLAEARLEAGDPAEALPLLNQAEEFDRQQSPDGKAHDPRVLMAMAETLARLKRYGEALPIFNRTYTESAVDAPHRFKALLGDLRCRTELGEDPAGIIEVIRQQRFLSPDMGGEALKRQFAELQERNEARRKG